MTYHDDQPVYRLSWPDGHELGALVVNCSATTLAAMLAVEDFDLGMRRAKRRAKRPVALVAALAAVFVEHVTSWDLCRDGRPVPVTSAAFAMLDRDVVVLPLLRQWRLLVVDPPRQQPADVEVEPEVPGIEFELVATSLTKPGDGELRILDGDLSQVPDDETGEHYVSDGYEDSRRVHEPV